MRLRQNPGRFPRSSHTLGQKKQHRHTQAAKLANYLPTLHAHKMHVTGEKIFITQPQRAKQQENSCSSGGLYEYQKAR